jgi:hypothetical protein
MSDQHFDYDQMIQEALKGVVVKILKDVSQNGLKGDHHYYVAFRTQDEGVKIPPQLKQRYSDEMTIVIQHRYWGLNIQDDYFEIGLSFDNKPELLVIPYDAIIGFVDPTAQFALQFDDANEVASNDTGLADDLSSDSIVEVGFKKAAIMPKGDISNEDKKRPPDNTPKVVTLDTFRKKK